VAEGGGGWRRVAGRWGGAARTQQVARKMEFPRDGATERRAARRLLLAAHPLRKIPLV
jgi:hypothetical protein